MARPRGKIDVVCQNPQCRYYLKEKGKDIIKSGKYKSTGHQRFLKVVSTRAPGTRDFIANIVRPILWRQRAHRYIGNNCPRVE
jgi:hypothetical protein